MREELIGNKKTFSLIILILGFWMVTPGLLQYLYGFSAPLTAFSIAIIYLLVFKIYQFRS